MQLTLTPQANSALRVSFDPEDRDEITEILNRLDPVSILLEGTEHLWTNGSYHPFDAGQGNPFIGLTEAPCIASSLDIDDQGQMSVEGDFWYYGDYMITNPIEQMLDAGFVDFTLAR